MAFFYHPVPREGTLPDARVAELVDAHVSGACSERSAGSSPVPGTKNRRPKRSSFFMPGTGLEYRLTAFAVAFGSNLI